ncbi:MAG: nucleotidyltransferase family protein [bacterium]|nr:nucleotidyltransferase family protein [bacterium]
MKNFLDATIPADAKLSHAISVIDATRAQIALVVDEQNHLLGTITDGDIRRAFLRGVQLDSGIQEVMNPQPTTARIESTKGELLALMNAKSLRHIPLLNEQGVLVGLEIFKELLTPEKRDNWVVLMVGGLGTRLRPLTDDTPKPLLKVGNKPILETIVEQFLEYGFHRFYFCVNYQSEKIVQHFGDGSRWGAEIRYVEEQNRMGTAGALGLLPERPQEPVVVMNGDLLTKANFSHLLDFLEDNQALGVMCVREYDFQVPYGVVNLKDHQITSIDEKPTHRFFVNAGIYALSPEALELIPPDRFFDMPELFGLMIAQQKPALAFPMREYWMDIGQIDDFHKARSEFDQIFG